MVLGGWITPSQVVAQLFGYYIDVEDARIQVSLAGTDSIHECLRRSQFVPAGIVDTGLIL